MPEQQDPRLDLQKIYLKDVSFESPNAPLVFQEKSEASTNVQIQTNHKSLEDNLFELVLSIQINIKNDKNTILVIELDQAGIFYLENFPNEQLNHVLHTYCAHTLFPYAREEISGLTTKGGFPPLLLAPVNFEALFEQQLSKDNAVKH